MDCGKEGETTSIVRYTKEFIWEIEQFTDWWSSREIAKSNRNDSTTWLEEIQDEKPQDWTKSTSSPIMTFKIEGVVHEFNLAILKYDNSKKHSEKKRKKNEACQIKKKHTLFYTYYFASSLRAEISPYFFFMHSEIFLSLVLL